MMMTIMTSMSNRRVWEVKGFDCIGEMMTFHFQHEIEIDRMLSNWGIEEFSRDLVRYMSYMFLEDLEDEENE